MKSFGFLQRIGPIKILSKLADNTYQIKWMCCARLSSVNYNNIYSIYAAVLQRLPISCPHCQKAFMRNRIPTESPKPKPKSKSELLVPRPAELPPQVISAAAAWPIPLLLKGAS